MLDFYKLSYSKLAKLLRDPPERERRRERQRGRKDGRKEGRKEGREGGREERKKGEKKSIYIYIRVTPKIVGL